MIEKLERPVNDLSAVAAKLNEVIDIINSQFKVTKVYGHLSKDFMDSMTTPRAVIPYEENCKAAMDKLVERLGEQKPTFTKEQRLEQLDRVMLATKRAMSLRKHNTTKEELEFYWNKYDIEIDKLKEML